MNKRPLTDKQQRFVAEYLVDLNATQAAIRAGYSTKTADDILKKTTRQTPSKTGHETAAR